MDEKHLLTRRHAWSYQDRPAFWYDYVHGQVIMPDGKRGQVPTSTDLPVLLTKIMAYTLHDYEGKKRAVTLFLCAGRAINHRPDREWFTPAREWSRERFFWNRLQAEYERNGFRVYLYGTGDFWGEEKDLDVIYAAWNALEKRLARAFRINGYTLRWTPASTGRDLLEVSLPKEQRYPRLPDNLLELITHNFGQARIETLPPVPGRETLDEGVYVLDARWMYASCISHLPVGPCYHDQANEFLGVRTKAGKLVPAVPGFYRVTVQVPEGWQHIGLLKAEKARTLTDDSASYPNEPGQVFTNWTTAAELALALDNRWKAEIHERLVWPETDKVTDPLATWRKQLVTLREQIEQEGDTERGQVGALLKDAIRTIVLHTLGSFNQYQTFIDHETLRSERKPGEPLLPVIPYKIYKQTADKIIWKEAVPLPEGRQRFIHPEWSATLWGRARAKLAQFALRLPYEDIVSLRTDSVWCASFPAWIVQEDDGKPGRFRVKEFIPGPWSWPKDGAAMRRYVVAHNLRKGDSTDLEADELDELEV